MAKEPVIEFPEIEDDPNPGAATDTVAVVLPPAAPGRSAAERRVAASEASDATSDATSDAVTTQVAAPTEIDNAVADLKRQLDAQRSENARLAAEAQQAQQEIGAARVETRGSNLAAVTNSIELTTQQLNASEAALAAAMEASDFKAVAKLQREIARNENKLAQLENGRLVLEQQIQEGERPILTEGRVTSQSKPQPQLQRPPTLDELASTVSEKSATWLRQHPEVLNSLDSRGRLAAAHDYALRVRGLIQDTPAYFAALEDDLGYSTPAPAPRQQQQQPAAPAAPRRPPTASAPANREATSLVNGRPQGSRIINLTPRQQDMARSMEMSFEEYAKYLYEDQVAKGLAN